MDSFAEPEGKQNPPNELLLLVDDIIYLPSYPYLRTYGVKGLRKICIELVLGKEDTLGRSKSKQAIKQDYSGIKKYQLSSYKNFFQKNLG